MGIEKGKGKRIEELESPVSLNWELLAKQWNWWRYRDTEKQIIKLLGQHGIWMEGVIWINYLTAPGWCIYLTIEMVLLVWKVKNPLVKIPYFHLYTWESILLWLEHEWRGSDNVCMYYVVSFLCFIAWLIHLLSDWHILSLDG